MPAMNQFHYAWNVAVGPRENSPSFGIFTSKLAGCFGRPAPPDGGKLTFDSFFLAAWRLSDILVG
jgi:hypothetical protein